MEEKWVYEVKVLLKTTCKLFCKITPGCIRWAELSNERTSE